MMHQDMSKNNFSSPWQIYPQTLCKTTRAFQTQLLCYEAVGEWMGLVKMSFNQTLAKDEKKKKNYRMPIPKGKQRAEGPWVLLQNHLKTFLSSLTLFIGVIYFSELLLFLLIAGSAVSLLALLFGFPRTVKSAPHLSWVVSYKNLIQLNQHLAIRSRDMLVLLWSALVGAGWKEAGR